MSDRRRYGIARLGSSFSLLDFAVFGSSISCRSFMRCGSDLSALGTIKLGAGGVSVLDLVSCQPPQPTSFGHHERREKHRATH